MRPPYPASMTKRSPFKYFKTSPEIIRLAVVRYVRYPLSLRNVEDLLHKRGIKISHETVRFWWKRLGPMFAAEIRRRRVDRMRTARVQRGPDRMAFLSMRMARAFRQAAKSIIRSPTQTCTRFSADCAICIRSLASGATLPATTAHGKTAKGCRKSDWHSLARYSLLA